MPDMSMGEAARAIGVSADTLRRWDRDGRMKTQRDTANNRRVPVEEVQRLRRLPGRHQTGGPLSARNRLAGQVVSVEVDGVMALVEIQVGADRITAAITRDSVEELGLLEGQRVFARIKATDVMVERGEESSPS
jgi:molybdopterin-binding protein